MTSLVSFGGRGDCSLSEWRVSSTSEKKIVVGALLMNYCEGSSDDVVLMSWSGSVIIWLTATMTYKSVSSTSNLT